MNALKHIGKSPEEVAEEKALAEEKRLRKNERQRKKREQKAKRKYRPTLPRKIVVIKNSEKDVGNWSENWQSPKDRNIACIPHSFRLLALGAVSRGKSNTMKNLFLVHQASSRPFKELYICTCSLASTEWNDLEPTGLMDSLPDVEFFDRKKKTCLIIDDMELNKLSREQERRLSTIFRFVSSHRNLSVMCGYQSFFDTHPLIRKCANVFLLYKPTSRQEESMIANRVGLDKEDLHYIFKKICNGPYDSLMVDRSVGTPYPLRRNVYEPIVMNEDSDSE